MKLPYVSKPDEIPINDYHGEKFKEFYNGQSYQSIVDNKIIIET